ncbi:MAG: hypothetical protein H7Y43_13940 [Akkermansiaceae bacterium]|nr:hypothetical protein [Verrucomicrobiales bacterium]
MSNQTRFRLLRLVLFFCALVWGVSAFGVFLKWETASGTLQGMGAKPIAYDPMLDYWLRMASGAFALVGTGYLLLAIYPRKFAVILAWFGWIMVIEGVILLGHGLRLGLAPFPFIGDVSASLAGGMGILALRKAAVTNQ